MADEKEKTATETTTEKASEAKDSGAALAEGTVSKAEFERAMADMHKYKAKARELEDKAKKQEEERLRQTGEWQKIAELKSKEAEEKDEKIKHIEKSLVEEKKFMAIKEAAMKAGMTEQGIKDLELLSFKDVIVETTSTGRVNVLGADRFIELQKQIRPTWFQKPNLNINGKIPGTTTAAVANEKDLLKMSLEASKSGDYTAYKKALDEYQHRKRGV